MIVVFKPHKILDKSILNPYGRRLSNLIYIMHNIDKQNTHNEALMNPMVFGS